jgi:hypothetical protein
VGDPDAKRIHERGHQRRDQHLSRARGREHTEEEDEYRNSRQRPHRRRLRDPTVEQGDRERVRHDERDPQVAFEAIARSPKARIARHGRREHRAGALD